MTSAVQPGTGSERWKLSRNFWPSSFWHFTPSWQRKERWPSLYPTQRSDLMGRAEQRQLQRVKISVYYCVSSRKLLKKCFLWWTLCTGKNNEKGAKTSKIYIEKEDCDSIVKATLCSRSTWTPFKISFTISDLQQVARLPNHWHSAPSSSDIALSYY